MKQSQTIEFEPSKTWYNSETLTKFYKLIFANYIRIITSL